jgi:N-acetylglucosaminyldiphosphoundecaprenol N-acetyl-beta-D-mannosaminyltransferase
LPVKIIFSRIVILSVGRETDAKDLEALRSFALRSARAQDDGHGKAKYNMHILGVKIDNISRKEILEKVNDFASEEKFHQIATVNPEFIIEAQKNPKFKKILNDCDLNVADGTGIFFAFLRFGKKLKCRFTGVDLMDRIMRVADKNNLGIFLAANDQGLSTWEETRDAMVKIYPGLNVDGDNISPENQNFELLSSTSQVVFCNFGAPAQEFFINHLKSDKIRIAMGVGGSFDFLTGKVKRAPGFWRLFGLEWLWRLAQKPDPNRPRRWKRIWRAIIIFPIRIVFNKQK